jgi:hypothetical protein
MAPIPGILETWDTLKSAAPSEDTERQASLLKARCYDLHLQFEEWHHHLATAGPSFVAGEAKALRTQIETLALEDLPDVLVTYGHCELTSGSEADVIS